LFFRNVKNRRRLPFEGRFLNATTRRAIEAAKRGTFKLGIIIVMCVEPWDTEGFEA